MAYQVTISRRVKRYLRKLKDQRLQTLIVDAIYKEIAEDPEFGVPKVGDLSGYRVYTLHYVRVEYRIAYIVRTDEMVSIVMIGTHENFYQQLKHLQ